MRSPRWAKAGPVAAIQIAAALITAALAVSACSSTGSNGAGGAYGSGGGNGGYGATSSSGAGAMTAALKTETTSAGTVLADGEGMTLYYYAADKPNSGKSSCSGGCASAWPPFTGTVQAPSGVTLPGPISTITRPGGVKQVTVNGYPLYTYAEDKAPGQVTGNGVEGEWHVIKLAGSGAAAGSGGSAAKGGLMKLELTTAGKVLANPHGLTVYYYTGDKPGSGVSSCVGGCAATWPPVVAPVRFPASMKLPGPVSVIIRPGGVRQVTLNGYPLYRYADDKAPGQATGNGAGGEWHVIKL